MGFRLEDVDDDWLPVSDFLEEPAALEMLPGRIGLLAGRGAACLQSELTSWQRLY